MNGVYTYVFENNTQQSSELRLQIGLHEADQHSARAGELHASISLIDDSNFPMLVLQLGPEELVEFEAAVAKIRERALSVLQATFTPAEVIPEAPPAEPPGPTG